MTEIAKRTATSQDLLDGAKWDALVTLCGDMVHT
jgi:hypothetical protein